MEINLAIQENINVMSEKIRLKNLGINMDFAPVLDIKRFQESHAIRRQGI